MTAVAIDGGGHGAASVDYQGQGSLGGIAGASLVASPAIKVSGGYEAQLPGPNPVITGSLAASGSYGSAFAGYTIAAQNLPAGYTVSGLPGGLTLDPATGIITGIPQSTGVFNVTIGATNEGGTTTATLILNIAQAAQTISFNSLPDTPYAAVPITLIASATSGLPVSFSVITGYASVSGSALTLGGAGLVSVRASQPGNANYTAAPVVDRSFAVTADFASWQLGNFATNELPNTAVSGPAAVYGQDGLPNLVKYALGLAPKVNATAGLPTLTTDGTDWIYTFTRPTAVSDITVSVEFSSTLSNWTATGVTLQKTGSDGVTDTYRATYPVASAANAFFRLNIAQP